MAVRPVDLQQVVVKAPEVTRNEASQERQGTIAQQALAGEVAKAQDERRERVQQFEQAEGTLIREREARSGGRQAEARSEEDAEDAETAGDQPVPQGARRPALGRHIDIRA